MMHSRLTSRPGFRSRWFRCVAALVALAPVAFAQPATPDAAPVLDVGKPHTGILSADPPDGAGQPFDLVAFEGQEGEEVTLTLRSEAFDAYLSVGRVLAGRFRALARDDDGAGPPDARVTVRLPRAGTYLARIEAADATGHGAYTVRLDTGRVETEPAVVLPTGPNDPSGRYALLVGIDDYPGEEEDLFSSVADVALMRALLVDRFGFAPDAVVTLTDHQATRSGILDALVRHLGKAGPDGLALFYYSGHGIQADANRGLVEPFDPEPDGRDEALYVWGKDEASSLILDDELGLLSDRLSAGRMVMILDACHSGTGTRSMLRTKQVTWDAVADRIQVPDTFMTAGAVVKGGPEASGASAGEGLGELMTQPQRHLLLTAARAEESALPARGWPDRGGTASVFTYFLLRHLEAADAETTFGEVMDRVRAETADYAGERGLDQTPQLEGAWADWSVERLLGR